MSSVHPLTAAVVVAMLNELAAVAGESAIDAGVSAINACILDSRSPAVEERRAINAALKAAYAKAKAQEVRATR